VDRGSDMRLTEAQIGEIVMLILEKGGEWGEEVGTLHPYTEYYGIHLLINNGEKVVHLCVGKCVEDAPEGYVLLCKINDLVIRLNAGDVSALRETEFVQHKWETKDERP